MENLKLILTILIFSLLFPVFSFGFTLYYGEPSETEFALDPQILIVADIYLTEGESHNITFNGDQVYYNLSKEEYRVYWRDAFLYGIIFPIWLEDGIILDVQGPASEILNNWWFTRLIKVKGYKTGAMYNNIVNSSIIENWDNSYNWSRFITEGGSQVFITPYLSSKNITQSINEGIVTVSLARSVDADTNINLFNFVDWYLSLLIGDNLYGLPVFFSWIIRLISVLSVFSLALVIKELLKL